MGNLGLPELMVIFLIVLLIFGAKKIPEIAKGLGKGINEFKKAKDGLVDDLSEEDKPKPANDAAKSAAAKPPPSSPDKPADKPG